MINMQNLIDELKSKVPGSVQHKREVMKKDCFAKNGIWDNNTNQCIPTKKTTKKLMNRQPNPIISIPRPTTRPGKISSSQSMPRPKTRPKVIQKPATPGTNIQIKSDEEENFIEKYKTPLIIGGVAILGIIIFKNKK